MVSPSNSRAPLALAIVAALAASALVLSAPPARAGTAVVFSEDFESGALSSQWTAFDNNTASGLDYWDVTDYRNHTGAYSAWCAEVGTQALGGQNNSAVHQYDDDMQAELAIDLRVSGFVSLTLSFYYWSRSESGGGDFIQAWYEVGGTQNLIFTNTGGTGNQWRLESTAVPNDVERLIIRFATDGANHNFEGAYVDDIVMTGVENDPPSSNVGALPTYTNVVPYDVPFAASDGPNASGVDYVELWYRMTTSGPFTLYTRPANPLGRWTAWASPTIRFDPVFAGGDGYYEFYTVAVDNASNAEAPPAGPDASMTIDSSPPTVTITAPAANAWIRSVTALVEWQGSDTLSGIDHYEIRVDGGPFSSVGTGTSSQPSGLAEGSHNVDIRGVDRAMNMVTVRATFGVDTVGPSITIITPSSGAVSNANTVTFAWNAQDVTSGVDHYEVWIDGGTPITLTEDNATITAIPDGTHVFHIVAVDVAGNRQEATLTFRVDTNPYGWLLALLLAALVGGFLFFLVWWRRRKETKGPASPSESGQEGRAPETPGAGKEPEPGPPDTR